MGQSSPTVAPMVLGTILPCLAIAAVAARFGARRMKRAPLKIDDWMLVLALLFTLGNCAILLVSAIVGKLGQNVPLHHGVPIADHSLKVFMQTVLAAQVVSTIAFALIRFSILLLYARIFQNGSRMFDFMVRAMYLINGVWGVAFAFTFLFGCVPISDYWNVPPGPDAANTNCLKNRTEMHNYVYAISSVLIDVAVLVIPWPSVMRLQMPLRTRFATIGIFMLGGFVVGVSIGKAYAFFHVGHELAHDHHMQHVVAPTLYWAVPETCVSVICACLPTLRPLFGGKSLDSVVNSLRGVFSLMSVSSMSRKDSASESEIGMTGNSDDVIVIPEGEVHSLKLLVSNQTDAASTPKVLETSQRL